MHRDSVQTGLDVLLREEFASVAGKSVGVLCNQAAITRDLRHITQHLYNAQSAGALRVKSVFGPQHGLGGHTQDNMIEWTSYEDPRFGWEVHSLYGEHRKPTSEMLDGVELLMIDIPDTGSRFYTYIWTMSLCLEACSEREIPVLVLDRPNPLGGVTIEGTVLDPEFASFIGLYPLPIRHGMTVGEIACHLRNTSFPALRLDVMRIEGWNRASYSDQTDLPWVMPSPNIPTLETAIVYPGMCLFEGTNLSEGRGTTRPFEMFGAPWIDGDTLCDSLTSLNLPGAGFRPVQFQPVFEKHTGQLCNGCFVHVHDRALFEPVLTGIAILQEIRRAYPDKFQWRPPGFEYEDKKLPIDMLAGNSWLREMIENLIPLETIKEKMQSECAAFEPVRQRTLIYK